MDKYYLNFFETVDLKNSIIFFLSDHGSRNGKFRQTFIGWYEDKLPMLWIYIGDEVQETNPDWLPNLQKNARYNT